MRLVPLLLVPALLAAAESARPNVVIFQADDMGFSDLGCYGSEIPTPNLDRLARRGVRFTQYYSNAKCEPTRNSLMTGQYPVWKGESGRTVTLAAEMREAGYRTCISGKVHMHTTAGFQRSYTMGACASYWDLSYMGKPGDGLMVDGQAVATLPAGFYTTDAFSDEAVRWLEQDRGKGGPFFLYVAFNAPHYPLHAPAADIARHRGRYQAGWDVLRSRRFASQCEQGFWPAGMQAAPREEPVKAWDALTPGERDREDLRMATYAAMVERMDAGVGRVLDAIERLGATQDTLVMFASDNGADGKDQKTTGPEPGPAGSWWYAGPGWAWASNTPFRKFKTWNHEGGISDPLIVSWPARIKPGWDRQVAHVTDITATCLAAAGRSNGRILGQSLLPGAERRIHQELCWAVLRAKAIRSGDLKAVTRADGPWELYDLAKDRTELHDLAQERPEVLAGMTARWQEWSKQVEIIGGRP